MVLLEIILIKEARPFLMAARKSYKGSLSTEETEIVFSFFFQKQTLCLNRNPMITYVVRAPYSLPGIYRSMTELEYEYETACMLNGYFSR